MIDAQVWKGSTFSIERKEGPNPGTIIFRLSGPFTARDMYSTLTPLELRNLFEMEPAGHAAPKLTIFDLTDVPYVDSSAIGLIVGHYVRCKNRGGRMIAAGVCSSVLQVFKTMRVDTFISVAETVEEAH